MSDLAVTASVLSPTDDPVIHLRIAASAAASAGTFPKADVVRAPDLGRDLVLGRVPGTVADLATFRAWFADCEGRNPMRATRIPLIDLKGWDFDLGKGNLTHHSGRFFTVEGLDIHLPGGPVEHWTQPIINQSEIGILGILVKEFHGVLHCLMQAKAEPGNCNGMQLSPTVQATRSNYTQVHRGRAVPYLDYFRTPSAGRRVIADVRQSEQGSWFHLKRNRNMIIEVADDVPVHEDFRWLTIGQIHRLLMVDNLVNMDARTVLSCLPFTGPRPNDTVPITPPATMPERPGAAAFHSALRASCSDETRSLHTTSDILSWITEARVRHDLRVRTIPLRDVRHWIRTEERIQHESGRFFSVIGLRVAATGREVRNWCQPLFEPVGVGIVAFLVRRIGGILHVLAHAGVEPGHLDVVELAPTVQCSPANYDWLPAAARPAFLDEVLRAPAERVWFDTVLSEEGGRFFHARNRYLIVETDRDVPPERYPDFRWMPVHQLVALLRHSHYVNVQARTLVACLHSLAG